MKNKIYLIAISLLIVTSCSGRSKETQISGEVSGGLRHIEINVKKAEDITLYRGDYIVLNTGSSSSVSFKVEALGIDTVLPRPESEKPYIKIKKSGSFEYTIGDKKGHLNILEYSGSNYKELTATDAVELIKNIEPFILDVRTTGEYQSGHLINAGLLPVNLISDNLDKLESFKDEPILVYCQSGNRSTVAAKILVDAGFTNIYNLRYGIGDWKSKGFPLER